MTLSQIIELALIQLGEDLEDRKEFDAIFKIYANIGYQKILHDMIKPRSEFTVTVDEDGKALVPDNVARIIAARVGDGNGLREVPCVLLDDGECFRVLLPKKEPETVYLECEIKLPDMCTDTDTPEMVPETAHPAIADYICYHHLMNGNLAKQSRAGQYLQMFNTAMWALRPVAMGSVIKRKNLYESTGVR